MQDVFDPYYKWLGIPPQDQPPHHYRLLAVPLFESDPEVIESAADQRMGHVRTFQRGRHSALSQQILNELAAARVCLLSHERKLAYDAELQSQLAPSPPQAPPQIASSVLPSPPPPVSAPPPQAEAAIAPPLSDMGMVPPQVDTGIAPPPSGGILDELASFSPMDAALPAPTPPVMVPGSRPPRPSRTLAVMASALGVTLLLFAAVAFWILYRGQELQDSSSSQASSLSELPRMIEAAGTSPEPVEEPTDEEEPADEAEPADQAADTNSETVGSTAEEAGIPPDDLDREDAPTPEPTEPPLDPGPMSADLVDEGGETETPTRPTLADLLEEASENSQPPTNDMESSQSTDEESDEDSAQEKSPEKWRVPKPAVRNRVAIKLQPLLAVPGNFPTLLVEAQKSDRPDTEVYVLLTAAHNKAVAALDADAALQAIDLIEDKFYGDLGDQRVESLRTIGGALSQQRNSRQLRHLADVALRASQEAQQEENKPLARELGKVALEAANQARDTVQQRRIQTHLDQL